MRVLTPPSYSTVRYGVHDMGTADACMRMLLRLLGSELGSCARSYAHAHTCMSPCTCTLQMGRGRSTIGMIVVYLIHHHITASRTKHADAHEHTSHTQTHAANTTDDGLEQYRRGEYDVIIRLVRLLKNGQASKELVTRRMYYEYATRARVVASVMHVCGQSYVCIDAMHMLLSCLGGFRHRYMRSCPPPPRCHPRHVRPFRTRTW